MSMRCYLTPVSSIEPLRKAIASGDQNLVQQVVDWYIKKYKKKPGGESEQGARSSAEDVIMRKAPPKKEPGVWGQFLPLLAEHLGLAPHRNPLKFNEGYRQRAWTDYRDVVKAHIPAKSDVLLQHLESGRPLRSKAMEYDGCLFAWLTADEVKELHASLSALSLTDDLESRGLLDFHELFVEALQHCTGKSLGLFLSA